MVERQERYIETNRGLMKLQDFLLRYYSDSVSEWDVFLQYINEAFNINGEETYKNFLLRMGLKSFDYKKMRQFYQEIKENNYPFDEDVLKFIAFLKGVNYFERIGNPHFEIWLNARDFNRPFDDSYLDTNRGFSLLEVAGLKNGSNAIKHQLLSALNF